MPLCPHVSLQRWVCRLPTRQGPTPWVSVSGRTFIPQPNHYGMAAQTLGAALRAESSGSAAAAPEEHRSGAQRGDQKQRCRASPTCGCPPCEWAGRTPSSARILLARGQPDCCGTGRMLEATARTLRGGLQSPTSRRASGRRCSDLRGNARYCAVRLRP